jgi:glycosyltransferase involved in cell wall biosynthesis
MKVLLIDVYNYVKGGAEAVCFNTGELLEKKGHEVIFFTLKWAENNPSVYEKYFPESKETRKGYFKNIRNLINYFYHFEAARKMEQLILAEKPDIAHIHLIWGQITPSILPVLKKFNIPVVFTVHDYRIVCPAYSFKNGRNEVCELCRGKYFYKCFVNKCTKNNYLLSLIMAAEQYFRNIFYNPSKYIDGLIYVSNFAKDIHQKYMPALQSIPNIILYNFSKEISPDLEHQHEKFFLYFGRLSYEKGLKTLLSSIENEKEIKIKIVGSGPLEKELKELKEKKNLSNVDFLGYKKGQALKDIVSRAYFVIVPSEWYENNPMTIIESYSLGVPVIGSDIGGIPEIIEEENTGFIFEPGTSEDLRNKILQANSLTMNEYNQFRENCLNYAKKHFASEEYYEILNSFYKEMRRNC